MISRRYARRVIVGLLYSYDILGFSKDETWNTFFRTKRFEYNTFVKSVFDGVILNLSQIDRSISMVILNWKLDRTTKVDRAILRMATFELLFHKDTPKRVVINEAIDLAKELSTEDSGKFVNGILDKIGRESVGQSSGL